MTTGKTIQSKGLLYVEAFVNSKGVRAMVDSGATNNFVALREVERLGLTIAECSSRLKAVNSQAKPINGSAVAKLKVGEWEGETKLLVVPLDDFDLILGIEFLSLAKAMVAPHLGGVIICDEDRLCFV